MSKEKKVSVVMCTYNGEKFLKEQLDSIVNQTYPIFELIIQDDDSKDGTWQILQEYAERYSYIKLFRNQPGKGVNGNFFSAMRKATGDYIAISDQDDIWRKNKIELQINNIGDKLLCAGHSKPFSTDGSFAHYDSRRPNINLLRLIFSGLPGHTMLFRRELVSDILPEDNELYHVSFYDVALELAAGAFGSIAYCDEVLVDFRRHSSATTYTDFSKNLPSVGNAFYILKWSVMNYKKVRPKARKYWHARLSLLKAIPSEDKYYKETVKMLHLELQDGLVAFVKLQWLFVKNRKVLFHTTGGGVVKAIRAFLYPMMQYYNYR